MYSTCMPGITSRNGLLHTTAARPLPPYGSCLLGSINLTKLVLDPFTDKARFDWDRYREVFNARQRGGDQRPAAEQRHEITYKRRQWASWAWGPPDHARHALRRRGLGEFTEDGRWR